MPSSGTVQVRVSTSAAQLPLAGATVLIGQQLPTGKYDLISVQQTDSSGLTRPVAIAAPPPAQSSSPSVPGAPPAFALCDVWAEVSGYGLLQSRDVQIFPGIETVQQFTLPLLYQGQADLTLRESTTAPAQEL